MLENIDNHSAERAMLVMYLFTFVISLCIFFMFL